MNHLKNVAQNLLFILLFFIKYVKESLQRLRALIFNTMVLGQYNVKFIV